MLVTFLRRVDCPSHVMNAPVGDLFVVLLGLGFSIIRHLLLPLLILLLLLFVSLWLLVILPLLLLVTTLVLGSIGLYILKQALGEGKSTLYFLELSSDSNDILLLGRLYHQTSFHLHLVVYCIGQSLCESTTYG